MPRYATFAWQQGAVKPGHPRPDSLNLFENESLPLSGTRVPALLVFESEASSAGSAASTSASNEQATGSSGSANPTSGDEACSPTTGLESPATTTLFVSENQRAEVLLTPYARQLT